MCGKTARTGLWGSRWETAGSTRIRAPQPASTVRQGLGQVREFKSRVAKTTCLSPDLGTTAGLERPTGAWSGPPGQESGRPNSVSVRISRPPCALSVTLLKVES